MRRAPRPASPAMSLYGGSETGGLLSGPYRAPMISLSKKLQCYCDSKRRGLTIAPKQSIWWAHPELKIFMLLPRQVEWGGICKKEDLSLFCHISDTSLFRQFINILTVCPSFHGFRLTFQKSCVEASADKIGWQCKAVENALMDRSIRQMSLQWKSSK